MMAEEMEELDIDNIVFRRADPDDTDAIINLVEIGEDDIYNRVYSYPKVLKLIETAYLAITAIDGDGNVVGFAAFEDYPQGMRGMVDDKHHNYWEDWFHRAYDIKEFASFNTLWLTYFIAGGVISMDNQHMIFKQMLQTVYTSAADLIGVLFLVRGDADEDDIHHCFDPLSEYFERLPLKDKTVMQNVRGVHRDSEVFFSSRVHVIPFIEVRTAKQEDHDDLADVFNAQSETVTEAYGEYFIAELIASQNEKNKALVAQVKDKAVGLMGLTRNVDLKLLHECFELDPYDNLLKPEMMDAVRSRRDHIRQQMHLKEENTQIDKLRKLKEETMRCNIIA
jgi:hypothetical protein